ncbi:MAG: hypothetical protein KAR79_05210, partial [Simkaniaceae bacterium]|nr:hypothetical protein [Simkaniaceae bacterium]
TAERYYRPFLDQDAKSILCKDIWFGGISFNDKEESVYESPELVVVVYLKYGDYGKEAAPIAAEIINKWREILAKAK